MDPRVKTPAGELKAQFDLAYGMYQDTLKATVALHEITTLREQLKTRNAQPPVAGAAESVVG